jgi:outer membrane protein
VTSVFVSVLRSRRQTEVAKAGLERAVAEKTSAAARVKAGGALRTSLLQAGLSVRRAEAQLLGAQRDARQQEVTFERIMGLRPATLKLSPERQPVPLAEARLDLARARADVRATRLVADAARHRVREARAARWPSLDAQLSYIAPSVGQVTSTFHQFSGSAVLSVPLFQSGNEYVAERMAVLEAQTAMMEEMRQWKLVEEEVQVAALELETAERTAEIAELQLAEARENYELVTNQYRLRTVTFLEVTSAQSVLSEAESLGVNASFDRELAAYRLLHAVGKLGTPP